MNAKAGRNVAAVTMALWLACIAGSQLAQPAEEARPMPVRLIVDYGDGVEKHFTRIPWREEMTVLDALKKAQDHPRGIRVRWRGQGKTAFVTRIDDLENEGQGSNWIFRVNGKLARQSCGSRTVKPGDTILWRFGAYR
jgi:hypothetical protein